MTSEEKGGEHSLTADELLELVQRESGFSSELKAFSSFLEQGIPADANVFYRDNREGKTREIDIVGVLDGKHKVGANQDADIRVLLVCEVKGTTAPTIIMSAPPSKSERDAELFSVFHFYVDGEVKRRRGERWRLNMKAPRAGRLLLKVLSKTERSGKLRVDEDWYRGFLYGVLSATSFFVRREMENIEIDFLFSDIKYSLVLGLPILIIDGPVFEFFYKDRKGCLHPVEYQVVRVSVPRDKVDTPGAKLVDQRLVMVCSVNGLPKLLTSLKAWMGTTAPEILNRSFSTYEASLKWSDGTQPL